MDLVPVLGYLFGSYCFGYFGLTTLSNANEVRGMSTCFILPSGHGSVLLCQGSDLVVSLLLGS
jgi:hypothetical protein